jgi:hypothetical protein
MRRACIGKVARMGGGDCFGILIYTAKAGVQGHSKRAGRNGSGIYADSSTTTAVGDRQVLANRQSLVRSGYST